MCVHVCMCVCVHVCVSVCVFGWLDKLGTGSRHSLGSKAEIAIRNRCVKEMNVMSSIRVTTGNANASGGSDRSALLSSSGHNSAP